MRSIRSTATVRSNCWRVFDHEAERKAALRAAEESMMAWQVYFDGFYYEGLKKSAGR